MWEVSFFVEGYPAPKGSFTGLGRGRMRNASKRTKPWQDLVSYIAMTIRPPKLLAGPVGIDLEFLMPVPKNPKHPIYPITKINDVDKLERTILDALSGIIYVDDCQVCRIQKAKLYGYEQTGVYITVRDLA